jgi:clathrin heavy chain
VDKKWAALFGISTPDGGKTINGHIQLYLIEGGKQQMI